MIGNGAVRQRWHPVSHKGKRPAFACSTSSCRVRNTPIAAQISSRIAASSILVSLPERRMNVPSTTTSLTDESFPH